MQKSGVGFQPCVQHRAPHRLRQHTVPVIEERIHRINSPASRAPGEGSRPFEQGSHAPPIHTRSTALHAEQIETHVGHARPVHDLRGASLRFELCNNLPQLLRTRGGNLNLVLVEVLEQARLVSDLAHHHRAREFQPAPVIKCGQLLPPRLNGRNQGRGGQHCVRRPRRSKERDAYSSRHCLVDSPCRHCYPA